MSRDETGPRWRAAHPCGGGARPRAHRKESASTATCEARQCPLAVLYSVLRTVGSCLCRAATTGHGMGFRLPELGLARAFLALPVWRRRHIPMAALDSGR